MFDGKLKIGEMLLSR